ncbi:hypothetical protein M3P05_00390 [Sansalvadorimonas sp. 2012CJ34-2]|uniref:Uncharacterized protein n=1 Tax=Parendozoicomonas callyspongiae TaxID=2942213 RepID=A0ABT0PAI5_9GAMM|nr:protein-tyrosine phosphatase family protein [Sansalvadorimonas sp. 2012CJ34-2]MCL6268407.1 hypothetical protein [Sansalvadorimonas sp. 2012CJ34-2]
MNKITLGASISPGMSPVVPKEVTDEELDQQFDSLPKGCSRNRGFSVTNSKGVTTDWDANLISLSYNSRHILDVVAARAPIKNSFDLFWDLVRQNPAYLINLASKDGANYLSHTHSENASECSYRNLVISESTYTASPSSNIPVYSRTIEFSPSTKSSERVTVPSLEVLNWPGQKGLMPADLHFLVLILQATCCNFISPGVIHCHYGIGRTATLIIAMALKTLSDKKILTKENLENVLRELITYGRETRDKKFVESAHQYRSLYRYGLTLCSGLLPKTFKSYSHQAAL